MVSVKAEPSNHAATTQKAVPVPAFVCRAPELPTDIFYDSLLVLCERATRGQTFAALHTIRSRECSQSTCQYVIVPGRRMNHHSGMQIIC